MYALDFEGKCIWVNQTGTELTGYDAEELIGQNLHSLLHHHREDGETYKEEDCLLSQALARGEAANLDDDILWTKSGQAKPTRYVATPVKEEGQAWGQVVSCIDIARRREVERERVVAEVLHEVVVVCARAENMDVTLKLTLEQVMQGFHFSVAHAYLDGAGVGNLHVWRSLEQVAEEYRAASETASEGRGPRESLSRRALLLQRAVVDEVGEDGELRPMAAVPLLASGRAAGVMEFSGRGKVSQSHLLEVLNGAAAQVSWAAERWEGRARLKEQEGRVAKEIRDLETINRENTLLGEMGSLLDSCQDQAEMLAVLGEYGGQLFVGYSGALALLEQGQGELRVGAKWGLEVDKAHFGMNDCWALRRGRLHSVEVGGKLYCEHLVERGGKSVCVPLYNRGEALGVLSLYAAQGGEDSDALALRATESLSVALNSMQVQEMLREQKNYDALTGLGNRRQMEGVLKREIDRAHHSKGMLTLVVLDIDSFGKLNLELGKELGDIVLKTLSTSLSYQIRGRDLVCRTAGDEFAILFPETGLDVAQMRAKQIRERVEGLRIGRHDEVRGISVSMGLSLYEAGETPEAMLERARAALAANRESPKQGGQQ